MVSQVSYRVMFVLQCLYKNNVSAPRKLLIVLIKNRTKDKKKKNLVNDTKILLRNFFRPKCFLNLAG